VSGALPAGACDAHCHVFGPGDTFPYAPERTYTPEDSPKEALFALHRRLGIDRAVIVQPGAHGFDNRVTLDAITASGGRYRGVALVRDDATPSGISALDAGGMRGIRFNFTPHLGPPPSESAFRRLADLIAPFEWHVVVHVVPPALATVANYVKDLPVPVVIDHMARINAADGPTHDAFRRLLDLLKDPNVWVKISAADRASTNGAPYDDVLPYMESILEAAPDRTLWGTDFPHPNIKGSEPSKDTLLKLLRRAAGDGDTLERVLVDNPNRLYGFGPIAA
jgi:predicted TIM-barrel fold metal-dependent hydrolase